MLNKLNKFESGDLRDYLKSGVLDEDYISNVIGASFSRPGLIKIKNKDRESRDDFFSEVYDLISEDYPKVADALMSKFQIIKGAEDIFDRISSYIDSCEIRKKDKEIQIWSHIRRVELEFKSLRKKIEDYLRVKPKESRLTQYVMLQDEDGRFFSADAASEHLIKYLSMTIKLLAYDFDWFDGDKIVVPNRVEVDRIDVFQAGGIEFLARSWIEVEDVSQRSLLFGGSVYKTVGCDVQADARENGVKVAYYFERNESEYELYDAIACERVMRRSLQNFLEIISSEEVKNKVAKDVEKVGSLQDGIFISEDEVLACSFLNDVLCVDVLNDRNDYHGLTLAEWVRSYFVIRVISENIEAGIMDSVLTERRLVKEFKNKGVGEASCLRFIDLVTFSRSSSDIFDCPIIKMSDGFYISYYGCLNFNVCNIVLSRFSSLDTDLGGKGYRFEDSVNKIISEKVGECKGFKFRRKGEEYEFDAVFILGKRIFILECKNRSLSWNNPVKAFRNRKELLSSVRQASRLRAALIEYPEIIKEKFFVDCSSYEVVPVVLNCMPFSWSGSMDGVYISDWSSLSRLLRCSNINSVYTTPEGQKIVKTGYRMWEGEKLSSDDIINHFDKPVQVLPYLESRKSRRQWWVADGEVAFVVKTFEVDPDKYLKKEKKIFGVSKKNKNKKKSKSERSLMVRNSRRKYRKR